VLDCAAAVTVGFEFGDIGWFRLGEKTGGGGAAKPVEV